MNNLALKQQHVSRNLKLDESQKDLNFDPNQKKTCESQK
jgi:hypothetical protein